MASSFTISHTSHTLILLLILLHSPHSSSSTQRSNETDRLALVAIKARITHDPHGIFASWKDSLHFCTWPGVTCGRRRRRVTRLNLAALDLVGTLSPYISNLTFLKGVNLEHNNFQGEIPPEIGGLFRLHHLNLTHNSFSGQIPANLSGCSRLVLIRLAWNDLTGVLPFQLGELENLEKIELDFNNLSGKIPESFCNLTKIRSLSLAGNNFGENFPAVLSKLKTLEFLELGMNNFSGMIPPDLGLNLPNLRVLNLADNPFGTGESDDLQFIESLKNCKKLEVLDLSNCGLGGTLPYSIANLSRNLLSLNLGENKLSGDINVGIGNLVNLSNLELQENRFSGMIPSELGNLTKLHLLDLSENEFLGYIPSSFSYLTVLRYLNLSCNNLSGQIPEFFGRISFKNLNLSYNQFEGCVPSEGVFGDLSALSIVGNDKLCGGVQDLQLPMCPENELKKKKSHHGPEILMIPLFSGLVLMACLVVTHCLIKRHKHPSVSCPSDEDITYDTLHKATDGFSSANLIGASGYGSVYKATLELEHKIVAVKVFDNVHNIKNVMSECRTLSKISHRNLVSIYAVCLTLDYSGSEFKALVYEFMPNGNLESWIHADFEERKNKDLRILGLLERLNIAIDVARALDYLHRCCERTIVHCDLKPSNVLLDDEMIAHLGDFGLLGVISGGTSQSHPVTSSVGMWGTDGYAPPEYGSGSAYSPDGDVYSFGVLLLEMFTGKRPTDSTFADGSSLHDFVKTALPERVREILDPNIVLPCEVDKDETVAAQARMDQELECLISIMSIGVACLFDSPIERMDIADVVKELGLIKDVLLAFSTNQGSTSGSLRYNGSSSRSATHNWQNIL